MTFAQQVVVLILSGGGAAAIFTLVKALLAVRGSTDTREATAIANLERWRVQADERADGFYNDLCFERGVSAYWMRRSAQLEHAVVASGGQVPPTDPPPIRAPGQ